MTEPEVYELLTRVFHEVFERNDITVRPGLTAKDLFGWDSFKQVEILMQIEEEQGFKFSASEIDRLQNVGDLARAVLAHVSAKGAKGQP